jgi:hypothetical protein
MDQPTGVYNIVWRCGKDLVPERLETYITKPAEGGRSFFMTRHLNEPRKRKTYEQCAELPGSNPSNASQRPAVPPPAINPLDPNTPLPPVPAQQPPKYQ